MVQATQVMEAKIHNVETRFAATEQAMAADLFHAVRTKLQLMLYELEPVLIDIIPERHARLLFKKDAQVMPGVPEFFCQVLQVGMFR